MTSNNIDLDPSRIFFRPPGVLNLVSLEYRWEFTRRHPIYMTFWKTAARYYRREGQGPEDEAFGRMAMSILLGLGVTGEPPDPATDFSELDRGRLANAWLQGGVSLPTFGGLALMLLRDLPPQSRGIIGALLTESANRSANDETDQSWYYDAAVKVLKSDDPGLKSHPNRPLVGIHIEASERTIQEAITCLVSQWKQDHDLSEQRRVDHHFADYLKAWDLREGWIAGRYHAEKECRFKKISGELRVPVRTIASRYQSAFRWITGHDYSFSNWVRLFSAEKLIGPFGTLCIQRRRDYQTRQQSKISVISETNLQSPHSQTSFFDNMATSRLTSCDLEDLTREIKDLITSKISDQEIIQRLKIPNHGKVKPLLKLIRTKLREISK